MPDPSLAGAYNLPRGQVPIVDGEPKWPWDDEVARERLAVVAGRLGLRLTGGESRLDGASNDTWLLGEQVLRVCWRGDLDRLAREAALLLALPEEIPAPRPLECDRDDDLSWLLMPRLPGIPLADVPERRGLVRELGAIVRAVHAWQPPQDIRAMVEAAAPRDDDDALTITGKRLVPLARAQQLRLADYVRTMPFVPGELVDAIVERLPDRLPEEPEAFLHGDLTPGNVLVHERRISGLLDWEWAWFGPAGTESTLPLWWARYSGDDDYVAALTGECPELFASARQRWVYLAAFALRCIVHWPPDRPERDLYPDHPLLLLRDLVS
ncbi:MAG TPA: aminoglycoside phosphotransferase family protein [Pseudonocardiaceae bacterium]|nr:aminoglycoside phosphotransferase family protein [Pseudonocardiaceae bacterium]